MDQSTKVFLVHGRDDARRLEVSDFLWRLGMHPTVLQDEPSGGDTVIEKFEKHAGAHSHVVVLATGDDLGALRDERYTTGTFGWVSDGFLSSLRPRARQNVILELGYFYAKPGRRHVTVLTTRDVELPSDISGVVVIYLDSDWKVELSRELRSAGLTIKG